MKYKVLLTGNNKMVINEFFTYMDFSFECFSTSDRYDDIINHVKYKIGRASCRERVLSHV